jgi:hypothetical protein
VAFERPIIIKEAVANVHAKRYMLPAIQREFVWEAEQIALLFDSLMWSYLMGAFLFWLVKPKNVHNYYGCAYAQNPGVSNEGGAGGTTLLVPSSKTGPEERL